MYGAGRVLCANPQTPQARHDCVFGAMQLGYARLCVSFAASSLAIHASEACEITRWLALYYLCSETVGLNAVLAKLVEDIACGVEFIQREPFVFGVRLVD